MIIVSNSIPRPDAAPIVQFNPVRDRFIATRIFPVALVDSQADNFDRVPATATAQLPADMNRTPGTGSKRMKAEFETDSYATKERSIELPLPDEVRTRLRNADPDTLWMQMVSGACLAGLEQEAAGIIINETNFPPSGNTGVTLTTAWDQAAATPASDISPLLYRLCLDCNIRPEDVGIGVSMQNYLNFHKVTDIRQRMQLSDAEYLNPNLGQLARYFNVGECIVADAAYNSANPGGTESITTLWNPDYAFLYVRPSAQTRANMMLPQTGRTFVWRGGSDAPRTEQIIQQISADPNTIPCAIDMYREEKEKQWVYRAAHNAQVKYFGQRFVKLIKNTIN